VTDATNIPADNYRRLERVVKGFANHRRLEILNLLLKNPELSVEDISERLNIGYENASDHLRKMAIAGLLLKRNEGNNVRHKLTPRAESVLVFCKTLE
jgi:DNA-binding transcriptional ArsR family regulator